MYANDIQRIDRVHSVRWRVKNAEHLMEKIIRKRAKKEEKYLQINPSNYHEIVTDLIGIRAIHLFKDDCFEIDPKIRENWVLTETPLAYVRAGDPDDFVERLRAAKFDTKDHPDGYRSVHYVVTSQPMARRVFTEIQVRTIFEEGWSEIDHSVRYPNFSENKLVAIFLAIFNRMSGSADEMGAFVKGLISTLGEAEKKLIDAVADKQNILTDMDRILVQLNDLKEQDAQSKALIADLRSEMSKLSYAGGALSHLFSAEQANLGLGLDGKNQKWLDEINKNELFIKSLSGLFPKIKK